MRSFSSRNAVAGSDTSFNTTGRAAAGFEGAFGPEGVKAILESFDMHARYYY